jgi:hypothetical protein
MDEPVRLAVEGCLQLKFESKANSIGEKVKIHFPSFSPLIKTLVEPRIPVPLGRGVSKTDNPTLNSSNHSLCAIAHAQFAQNPIYMRFDGTFTNN